jgi:hypothetical protein
MHVVESMPICGNSYFDVNLNPKHGFIWTNNELFHPGKYPIITKFTLQVDSNSYCSNILQVNVSKQQLKFLRRTPTQNKRIADRVTKRERERVKIFIPGAKGKYVSTEILNDFQNLEAKEKGEAVSLKIKEYTLVIAPKHGPVKFYPVLYNKTPQYLKDVLKNLSPRDMIIITECEFVNSKGSYVTLPGLSYTVKE